MQAAAQQTPPAPPAPPTPPPTYASPLTGQATITIPGIGEIPVPQSCAEISRIEEARSHLSDQISSARGRREEVEESLRSPQGPVSSQDRAGLEAQLATLDARIVQLEKDLALTGAQLTHAPTEASCAVAPGSWDNGPNFSSFPPAAFLAVPIVFTIFVLGPISIAISRAIWRRTGRRNDLPAWNETADRLQRLETAVDAIAIEIERVSENQRFVTRVLTEAKPVSVGARSSDPTH